jgi:hypothetical protein
VGSTMGAHYRHTTSEMAARVVTAIQARLAVVVHTAEETLETHPKPGATPRVPMTAIVVLANLGAVGDRR